MTNIMAFPIFWLTIVALGALSNFISSLNEKSKARGFERGQLARGLVKFLDRDNHAKWGAPEQVEDGEKEEFEEEQLAKGLVKYRGKWITTKTFERKQRAKGLVKFTNQYGEEKWGTPEKVKEWKKIDIGMQNDFSDLSPREFEEFVSDLFIRMGFQTEITPYVKDYGADIIARRGKGTVIIQVKKYATGHHVGAKEVQQTLGSIWKYNAKKSILVTTSDFTIGAEEQARNGPIELWNRDKLYEMIDRYILSKGATKTKHIGKEQKLVWKANADYTSPIIKDAMRTEKKVMAWRSHRGEEKEVEEEEVEEDEGIDWVMDEEG